MEDRERKREEEKEQRRKEFPEGKEGKECPKCHTINELEARFCEECGYEFEGERRCPKCGTVFEENDAFCSECGAKLKENSSILTEEKKEIRKEEGTPAQQSTRAPEREESAPKLQNVSSQDEELLKMKAYTEKIKQKEKKEPVIKKKTFSPLFSDKQKESIREMDKESDAETKRQEEEKKRQEEERRKREEERRRREAARRQQEAEEERKRQEEERKTKFRHYLEPAGDITFILTWEFSNSSRSGGPDIDMWIKVPNGSELSSSGEGCGLGPDPDGGKIDRDDTGDGTGGPERAFWPEGRAPKGKYEYGVRYYGGNGNVNFQLNVYINRKCIETKTGNFSTPGGRIFLGYVYYH